MPIIKPISDLRNSFSAIAEECHELAEPIYLTKNGRGDLVVMSIEEYERLQGKIELYSKLGEAEAESLSGETGIDHAEMMQQLREILHE